MDDEIETMMVRVRADTSGFARDVATMRATLDGPPVAGADRAGRAIETSLLRAVRSGKLGFDDLKGSALALSCAGVMLDGFSFDTMIASDVLDPGRRGHELKTLSMEVFCHKPLERSDVAGTGRSKIAFPDVPVERARDYLCGVADLSG